MKLVFLILLMSVAGLGAPSGAKFTKTKIILGTVRFQVEVANDDQKREQGLMGRTHLGEDEGMIFIFDQAEPQGFWMKNTLIPLSIGFFDAKGKLFQVTDMEPASPMDLSPKVYRSLRPAKFALEEPRGWFAKKKIVVNQTQLALPDLHLP